MNNLPEKKFTAGAISATVWKNSATDNFGREVFYRTVSFDRRYKDKDGNWQSSNSLRVNDLPKARLVLGEAYKYLMIRDDKKNVGNNELEAEIEEVI
mgnify:FL=1